MNMYMTYVVDGNQKAEMLIICFNGAYKCSFVIYNIFKAYKLFNTFSSIII